MWDFLDPLVAVASSDDGSLVAVYIMLSIKDLASASLEELLEPWNRRYWSSRLHVVFEILNCDR